MRPDVDEPRIPDTEDGRAAAVEDLMRTAWELDDAGRYEDVVELTGAWYHALERVVPDDELARAEVAMLCGWALHMTGDEHAAERALVLTLGNVQELVERYRSEAEREPSGLAATRLERAERAAGVAANHLGVLHTTVTHDTGQARGFLEYALRMLGRSPRETLIRTHVLANLSHVEREEGNPTAGRDRLREAIEALEAIPELSQTSEYPRLLAELAEIEGDLGDEDECERGLRSALDLAHEVVPGDSSVVAEIQIRLADRLLEWGSPLEAEIHLRQALGIYARTVGVDHPINTAPMYKLAHVLWSRGILTDAVSLLDHAGTIDVVYLRQRLEIGAEEMRLVAALSAREPLNLCLSMAWANPGDTQLAGVAFDAVLRRKTLTTEIFAGQRKTQRGHELEAVREGVLQLDALRDRLSEELLSGGAEATVEELVREIRSQEENLGLMQRLEFVPAGGEGELAEDAESPARVRRLKQWMSPRRTLSAAIPGDTALIEYARFARLEPGPWEQNEEVDHYLAFVWRGGTNAPLVVPLGQAKPIDDVALELRTALDEDGAGLEEGGDITFEDSETAGFANRIRAAAVDPALIAAGDVRRLLFAPDGELASVPFGILPNADGYLLDRYEIAYLTSGRDLLLTSEDAGVEREPPLIVADPDYDAGTGDGTLVEERFDRQAETRKEGTEVAALLGVSAVMDDAATERHVKAVRSPVILHVATHGWFLPDAQGAEQPEWMEHPRLSRLLRGGLHTWAVRSGLILAGFNAAWAGAELPEELGDGLLTAGEAAALELIGTELVVLSACETGLGGIVQLEGAFSLRRAFLMAGARAVVTTQWKVPDEPSRRLMLEFYRRLLAGVARSTALHDAQLVVRRELGHPYMWGGFVLHGDPGPLHPETLNGLRQASPEVEVGPGGEREAQRLLGTEAIRRGNLEEAGARLHPAAEAGDAESAALMGVVAHGLGDEQEAERWYELASVAGQPLAALALGYLRAERRDTEAAERWWRIAVELGADDASQALAASLYSRGEREEARRVWRAAAERGHPASLYALGNEAQLDGVEEEATNWWARAAEEGEPRAAIQLARLAQERGDEPESDRWWRKAAELGEPAAAKDLAMTAHEAGRLEEAIAMWRAAAERGDVESAHNLGVALEQRGDPAAEAWYRRAADENFPPSANNLGNLLERRGDLDGAASYWRVASEHGHERAPVALGWRLLDRGELDEAERWLRSAAERGNYEGAHALSLLLEQRGEASEAARWRESAAAAGQPEAAYRLGIAAEEHGDAVTAAQWWTKSAEGGYSPAASKVADLLFRAKRDEEAESWWETAAEAGDDDAAVALASRRLIRGDRDGARHAAAASAAAGGMQSRRVLALLDADKELLLRREERGHIQAIVALLQLAELAGKEDEARRWLGAAADAGDPDSLLAAGGMALQAGQDDAAERWLRDSVRRGSAEAARGLSELYERRGKRFGAAKWARLAQRLDEAGARNEAGLAAYREGEEKEAQRHWEAAARAGSVDAAANLSSTLVRGDGEASAERWLRLAADGADAGSASALGAALAERGKHPEARTWFDRAVELARGR
jgi:CHAT domain-containing protein/TPR repeat protein